MKDDKKYNFEESRISPLFQNVPLCSLPSFFSLSPYQPLISFSPYNSVFCRMSHK